MGGQVSYDSEKGKAFRRYAYNTFGAHIAVEEAGGLFSPAIIMPVRSRCFQSLKRKQHWNEIDNDNKITRRGGPEVVAGGNSRGLKVGLPHVVNPYGYNPSSSIIGGDADASAPPETFAQRKIARPGGRKCVLVVVGKKLSRGSLFAPHRCDAPKGGWDLCVARYGQMLEGFVAHECEYCLRREGPVYVKKNEVEAHNKEHERNRHEKIGAARSRCNYCKSYIPAFDLAAHEEWCKSQWFNGDKKRTCDYCLEYRHISANHIPWHKEEGHERKIDNYKECTYQSSKDDFAVDIGGAPKYHDQCHTWLKKGREYDEHVKRHQENGHRQKAVKTF